MRKIDWEREQALQDAAEQFERQRAFSPTDTGVHAYRLIYRAVRSARIPSIPDDFAHAVANAMRDRAEQFGPEHQLLWLLGVCGVAAGGVFAVPVLVEWVFTHARQLRHIPWFLLSATVFAMSVAWFADRAWSRRSAARIF